MDTASPRPSSRLSPPVKWSAYAGVFAFLCSALLLLILSPISNVLIQILGLPTNLAALLLAVPVVGIGTAVWWTVVERRERYTYRLGVVFGLLTVLATVLFWVLVFTLVWGPSLVLTGWFLIASVLVASTPAGLLTGLVGMYARRRLDGGLAEQRGGPSE